MKIKSAFLNTVLFALINVGLTTTGFAQEETIKKPTSEKKQETTIEEALKKQVSQYIKAWQKQDITTLLSYESWEGGKKFKEIEYLKAMDTNFKIHSFQITQVIPQEKETYKVLVLVTHNPPPQVAALVPPGKTVNSTLNQWWKKQGDKFVHLFHVEREKTLLAPKAMQPPAITP